MINVVIEKAKKLPGLKSAFINFNGYNKEAVETVRYFDTRKYDANTKIWEISLTDLDRFISTVQNDEIEITCIKDKKSKISGIPEKFTFKTKPYSYQKDGVEYGLNHDSFILADEPGLGKTKQLIDLAICRKIRGEVKQCLIVCCVNSLKYNWKNEIKTHSDETSCVLGERFYKNGKSYSGSNLDKIEDLKNSKAFFLITNIESFRNDDFIKTLIKNKNIQMIAADEFHLGAKNPQCSQGKGLQKTAYIKYKVAMSGTPIVNKPLDSYAILKWLGLEKSNFSTFKNYYCEYGGYNNYEIVGYKNVGVLKESLTKDMLRRLKENELDLPEKIITNDYVEMNAKQQTIYNEARDWTLKNIDLIANNSNPLSQLLRLRQATGYTGILSSDIKESCKFDRCEQLVDELISNGKKVVIFSNWTSITNPLYERLSKYNPILITGEIDTVERQKQIDKFQTDKNYKVCIGSIGALGTGLTMTAASDCIFLDQPWNYANYLQATDRLHRIGQKNCVHIINLLVKDTIDEKINELIYKKKSMADMLVDGKSIKVDKDMILNLIS